MLRFLDVIAVSFDRILLDMAEDNLVAVIILLVAALLLSAWLVNTRVLKKKKHEQACERNEEKTQ